MVLNGDEEVPVDDCRAQPGSFGRRGIHPDLDRQLLRLVWGEPTSVQNLRETDERRGGGADCCRGHLTSTTRTLPDPALPQAET